MNGQQFEAGVLILQRVQSKAGQVWQVFSDYRTLNGLRAALSASKTRLEYLKKVILTTKDAEDLRRLVDETKALEAGFARRSEEARVIEERVQMRITERNGKKVS